MRCLPPEVSVTFAGAASRVVAVVASELAFEQAAIGMAIVDLDGNYLAANGALCELVGRSENELLQVRWQTITHPDDVARGEQNVERTARGEGRTFRLPKRYIRPDGRVVWVLLTVSLVGDRFDEPTCLLTQVVDISDQRRSEAELAGLASVVEASGDAILALDGRGAILKWNPAAERMYGYTAAELSGRSVFTIVPADWREECRRLLARVAQGASVRDVEMVGLRRDGSVVPVVVTFAPLRNGSQVLAGSSCIARDMSIQRTMAGELEQTLAALVSARESERISMERSKALLSDAGHQLRNPVAGIRACVESVLRGSEGEATDQLLGEIARETAHISRLVDRLLRIARLAQGEPLTPGPCDVTELCRDEAGRAESLAPHLRVVIAADTSVQATVDGDAVRQIVRDLLDNARRHAAARIDVSIVRQDGAVLLRVADDGPGLAPGSERRAFEPFVSLDGKGGCGLGLTLSKALAHAHGGDLTYADRTFSLRIP